MSLPSIALKKWLQMTSDFRKGYFSLVHLNLLSQGKHHFIIRHIALRKCPFRFALSHLPQCGQLT